MGGRSFLLDSRTSKKSLAVASSVVFPPRGKRDLGVGSAATPATFVTSPAHPFTKSWIHPCQQIFFHQIFSLVIYKKPMKKLDRERYFIRQICRDYSLKYRSNTLISVFIVKLISVSDSYLRFYIAF